MYDDVCGKIMIKKASSSILGKALQNQSVKWFNFYWTCYTLRQKVCWWRKKFSELINWEVGFSKILPRLSDELGTITRSLDNISIFFLWHLGLRLSFETWHCVIYLFSRNIFEQNWNRFRLCGTDFDFVEQEKY